MRLGKDEDGQALVVAALSITLLLGFLALAVDVGILFRAKRNVQIAADAAAVAAALDYKYNGAKQSAYGAASAAVTANGYTQGVQVIPNIPPADGPNSGNNCPTCAEVQVGVPNPTSFMSMFGFGSINVTARAVAGLSKTEVYLLGGGSPAFNNIALPPGDTIEDSNDPLDLTAPPATGCVAQPATVTIGPGCYTGLSVGGTIPGAIPALNLSPGLYVINGVVTLGAASALTGSNVTIYFNNSITVDPNATVNLSAPISGPWNGILFFEDPMDTNSFALKGAASSNLQGIIYLPSATLDLSGAGNVQLITPLVVNQLTNTGTNITLQEYMTPTNNPLSPIKKVSLLE